MKRLGCDQKGGYHPLKEHIFFEEIDWLKIPEQTPPKLLPYLPSTSKGESGLRSEINVRDEVNMCDIITHRSKNRMHHCPLLYSNSVQMWGAKVILPMLGSTSQ